MSGKALKFAFTYGTLDVEAFDTLDDAIESAVDRSDAGSESLLFIEHAGRRYEMDSPEVRAVEDARREEWRAEMASRPTPTHFVEVDPMDDSRRAGWARVGAYPKERAKEVVAEWSAIVGPDRVRARRLRP